MALKDPTPELELQFSSDDATPTPWAEACERLEKAKVYWLSTVHPDGRPHVTPIASVWLDDALYFSTGQTERKAKNLELNPHCVITTGCNVLEGLDLVVEGDAVRVTDESRLQRLADGYAARSTTSSFASQCVTAPSTGGRKGDRSLDVRASSHDGLRVRQGPRGAGDLQPDPLALLASAGGGEF